MTTPLAHEPRPGDGLVPYMSVLVDRLYSRLPEVYRTMDTVNSDWPFKRYLAGALDLAGQIDQTVVGITGDRPIGPLAPEPWALSAQELLDWRAARATRASALGDPVQADAAWLTWMAQMVGARLDPAATEQERRDTIQYATSGWRGGTRSAIADAAKSVLTGTKYARVIPHFRSASGGGIEPGTVWDIVIVTLTAETPDPAQVLGAVLRKGVKPAGATLYHSAYQATWEQIEAIFPQWRDWEAAGSWDAIQGAGLVYTPIPGNLMPNPSFEVNTTGWAAVGGITTLGRVTGGVDGTGFLRITVSANGTGEIISPNSLAVTPGQNYVIGYSQRADLTRYTQFFVNYYDSGNSLIDQQGVVVGNADADIWIRPAFVSTAPVSAAYLRIWIQVTGMLSGEHWDLDAVDVRSTT